MKSKAFFLSLTIPLVLYSIDRFEPKTPEEFDTALIQTLFDISENVEALNDKMGKIVDYLGNDPFFVEPSNSSSGAKVPLNNESIQATKSGS